MSLPFEIKQDNGIVVGSNGNVIVTLTEPDGIMRRRRSVKTSAVTAYPTETVYVDVGGLRTYVQQLENGRVIVLVTRRDVYP